MFSSKHPLMLSTADQQHSMTELLVQLVSHPSRIGEDSCAPVLKVIADWFAQRGITANWLSDADGRLLGLWGAIVGARPGPSYLLDATADTAPFGDVTTWRYPPDQATVVDGWLYGRGSADSKAGIAVFCHVVADLAAQTESMAGTLEFVFDAEEHSGTFAGIRKYLQVRGKAFAGAMIGYPGHDRLVIGSRGFMRARLVVHGIAAHSGSSSHAGVNAITRAQELLRWLATVPASQSSEQFPLPPKVTPTGIRGGGSFSQVPDRCEVELDLRLTPEFDESVARLRLGQAVAALDAKSVAPTTSIEVLPGWPAYSVAPEHPMIRALQEAGQDAFGHVIQTAVAGPSNIGNLLATLGIPATAGLGVNYRNIHGPDECVELATLEPTYRTYTNAIRRLMELPAHD